MSAMAYMVVVLVYCVCLVLTSWNIMVVNGAPHSALLFMPSSCATPDSLTNRTCCPSYNEQQCGGPVRGSCLNILEETNTCVSDFDVTYFFSEFFDYACVCEGNYAGTSCQECAPGYTGPACDEAATIRVRRPFEGSSVEEREKVLLVFQTLKQTPHPYWPVEALATAEPTESWSVDALTPELIEVMKAPISCYDWLVSLHYYGMWPSVPAYVADILPGVQEYAHGAALLPWHRRITYEFEKLAQWVLDDSTWSMPYWDASAQWAGQLSTDPMLEFIGGSGDPNMTLYDGTQCDVEFLQLGCNCTLDTGPFAPWRTIKQFGLSPGDLPIQRAFACFAEFRGVGYSDVGLPTYERIGNWTTIPDFLDAVIEQPNWHTPPHNFFGYTMLAGSSPSDPAFYFIHSWVDFVFEKWIRNAMEVGKYGINNMNIWSIDIGQSRDECAIPFFPLQPLRQWFYPTYTYGYTYPDFETNDPNITTAFPLPDPYAFNSTSSVSTSGPLTSLLSTGSRLGTGKIKRSAHRARVAAQAAAEAQEKASRIELDATLAAANARLSAKVDMAATKEKLQKRSKGAVSTSSAAVNGAAAAAGDNELSHAAAKKERQHSKKHRLLRKQ